MDQVGDRVRAHTSSVAAAPSASWRAGQLLGSELVCSDREYRVLGLGPSRFRGRPAPAARGGGTFPRNIMSRVTAPPVAGERGTQSDRIGRGGESPSRAA